MDEPDLIKAIPNEVIKTTYDDALSLALKEMGKMGEDLVKSFRLVLFPLQYAAFFQDRLAKHLKKSLDQVPDGRRISPIESLALPIAEQLKYHDDHSIVGNMFVSLLARAMDRERVGEAHPAFVQIIGQLAPDEALLIQQIASFSTAAYMRPPQKGTGVFVKDERLALIGGADLSAEQKLHLETIVVSPEKLAQPELIYTYIEHLVSLGIISYTNDPWNNLYMGSKNVTFDFWFIELNGLGTLFHRACLSENQKI